jgi:mannose-6-phosphate isomerase-like protein (cupin superfamily)
MTVRRVVTENVDGRSRIADDRTAPHTEFWDDLWITDPDEPRGRPATDADASLQPPPGTARWRVFSVPTAARMRDLLGGDGPDDGAVFHQTDTVDLIYVLDGEVSLVLDDGEVNLESGDCVVQQQTNHAWRNRTDHPVRLLGLMTTLP